MADDGFVTYFDDDDIFEADGVELAWSVVVDKDVLATQVGMLAKGANPLLVRGEK